MWDRFVHTNQGQYKIDRVILDEAQEVLASRDFRPQAFDLVKERMDKISNTQIFPTGTLPIALQAEFLQVLDLDPDLVQVVRTPTTPRHVRFEYRATGRVLEELINTLYSRLQASLDVAIMPVCIHVGRYLPNTAKHNDDHYLPMFTQHRWNPT